MLIRYCASQIRIFAFYKNVPLMRCYLGLGLGCFPGARSSPPCTRAFLLWLIPLAVALAEQEPACELRPQQACSDRRERARAGRLGAGQQDSANELASQLLMAACSASATLVMITLLFALLGRLLGEAFEELSPDCPRTPLNIVGSLAGILAFLGCSLLETLPLVWFAVGLAPLRPAVVDRATRAMPP